MATAWKRKKADGVCSFYYRSTYGKQACDWLSNAVKEAAAKNPKIMVHQVENSFTQSSVIARILGAGTGVVVAGAHLDSTGGSSSAKASG
jgi:leucyl aminopeptidase